MAGQISLELQANPQRSARQAILNLRATTVEILPPQSHPQHQNLQPLRVQVILANEENPPDVKPNFVMKDVSKA